MGKMGGQGDMVYLGQKGRRRISDDDKDAEDNVSPSGISTPNYLPLAISPRFFLSFFVASWRRLLFGPQAGY